MPSIACHLSVCRLTDGIFISILAALSSRSGHLQAWVGVMCPSWPRGMHSVSRVVHFEQLAHFRDERQLSASDSLTDGYTV